MLAFRLFVSVVMLTVVTAVLFVTIDFSVSAWNSQMFPRASWDWETYAAVLVMPMGGLLAIVDCGRLLFQIWTRD